MKIYQSRAVKAQHLLYDKLLYPSIDEVPEHLTSLSLRLYEALQRKDSQTIHQVKNHHPEFLGAEHTSIMNSTFTLMDAQTIIAKEYGYKNWTEVLKEQQLIDKNFEKAIDYIVTGDLELLKKILTQHSYLKTAVSHFGHRATLLHYTASNGVEIFRQKVPENLSDVIALLLTFGLDKNAEINVLWW